MTKRKSALNSKVTVKPRGKPFTGRDDPRINRAGAPKRGQSWKEIYNAVGNLTPKEAADYCHAVAGKLASIGSEVTLKEAVVLRVYAALMFEPDARLLNAVMDRDEGKVSQPIAVEWREQLVQAGIDESTAAELFEQLVQSAAERITSDVSGGDSGSDPA